MNCPVTRIFGIDFETTGLDKTQDRAIELGGVLWDVTFKRPLATFSVFLIDDGIKEKIAQQPVIDMMEQKLGISPWMVEEFGVPAKAQLEWLEGFVTKHKIEYLVAHNAPFDRDFLLTELSRHAITAPTLRALPWIDTMRDIAWPSQPDSSKLKYVASDHGFINPFSHRAIFDVLTMLKVLSQYDLEAVVKRSQIPEIIVRAVVPHPKNDGGLGKDKAKQAGFRWQDVDGKSFPMMWVKKIKENELDAEYKKLPGYQVVKIG